MSLVPIYAHLKNAYTDFLCCTDGGAGCSRRGGQPDVGPLGVGRAVSSTADPLNAGGAVEATMI